MSKFFQRVVETHTCVFEKIHFAGKEFSTQLLAPIVIDGRFDEQAAAKICMKHEGIKSPDTVRLVDKITNRVKYTIPTEEFYKHAKATILEDNETDSEIE